VGGERSASPEDVGGVSGYEEFLEALFDPSHEEHEHMKSWIGRPFHPSLFSVDETNDRLRKKLRLGSPRKGALIARCLKRSIGSFTIEALPLSISHGCFASTLPCRRIATRVQHRDDDNDISLNGKVYGVRKAR
jgi:hypothetical protein